MIKKIEFARRYALPMNPNGLGLKFGLERLSQELWALGQAERITQDVAEKRDQPNRAYDIVSAKFRRSPMGEIRGWGLKVFLQKMRRAPGKPRSPAPTGIPQSNLQIL